MLEATLLTLAPALRAQTATTTSAPDAAANEQARRHFRTGIKLYRDTNYKGALAEFEAAYRDKPGPGSLQNVALSLKALFRYAEATDTLRLLLERHGEELNDNERAAVRQALTELEGLVGTLSVQVVPPNAELGLDGRSVGLEDFARGQPVNVGEHTLTVEANGYARHAQIVRIASQQRIAIEVRLKPTAGFLEVVASDPMAAIAIDDEPLAFARWTGPITPDVEHVVQVYRDGFEPFEQVVRLGLGQTLRLEGVLGPPTGAVIDVAPLPKKPTAPPRSRANTGLYALASIGVTGLNDAPLDLQLRSSNADMTVPSFGLRAGYRLSSAIAIEGAFDYGQVNVTGACQVQAEAPNEACFAERNFSLRSLRLGPNLRLMTSGETLRFVTSVGAGVVVHHLRLSPTGDGSPLKGGVATGADPYFSLELGAAYNFRHFLAELGVIALIEGAGGLRGRFDESERTAVFASGTLPMLGFTLKVGYSQWAPRR